MSIGNADIRDQDRDVIRANAQNAVFRVSKQIIFAAAAKASLELHSLLATNEDLVWTAKNTGEYGNDITVAYVDPGELGQALAVTVNGQDIIVSLESNSGTDEVQTLTITATGGKFFCSFRGQISGLIDYDATAAAVEAALEDIPTIGVGNVTVAGSDGGPYTITFVGDLAATNVEALGANADNDIGFSELPNLTTGFVSIPTFRS